MDLKSTNMPNINFVGQRKIWYGVSVVITVACIIMISVFGLRLGLDFTGGSLLEISYSNERPAVDVISGILVTADIQNPRIQLSEEKDVIIRLPELSEERHQEIIQSLKNHEHEVNPENEITEKRFESFGSSLGAELKRDSITAILTVLVAIIIYVAYAFRKVSQPVASWKFGSVAVIALAHDVIFVVGIFAALGFLYNTEIDSFFITALLTLLGFSVHDTIVTLDRVRENLFKNPNEHFDFIVNRSINETIVRSINTSFTTLLSLVAIYFFGGDSIKDFALALIVGIFIGAYSSIFIAAPLLVSWHNFSKKTSR